MQVKKHLEFELLLAKIKYGKYSFNKIDLSGYGLNDKQVYQLIKALQQLPLDVLKQFRQLDLSNNNLTQISICNFSHLNILDLSNNKLKSVILKNLPRVIIIGLQNNPIQNFDPTQFSEQVKLVLPEHVMQQFTINQPQTITDDTLKGYISKVINTYLRKHAVQDSLMAKYLSLAIASELPNDLLAKIIFDDFHDDLNLQIHNSLQILLSRNLIPYRSPESVIFDEFLNQTWPKMVAKCINDLTVAFANNSSLKRVVHKAKTANRKATIETENKPARKSLIWSSINKSTDTITKLNDYRQQRLRLHSVKFSKTSFA